MKNNKQNLINDEQKKALRYAALLGGIVALLMLWQFFAAIVAACITAVIFIPVLEWLQKKLKRKGLAVFLTIVLSVLTIVIPLIITIWVSVDQVQVMLDDLEQSTFSTAYLSNPESIDSINDFLGNITDGRIQISLTQVEEFVLNATKAIGEIMLRFLSATASTVPGLITAVIIYFYVYIALLNDYKKLVKFLRRLNPLGDQVSELFIYRAKAMTNSMVKGQFVVAIVQGVVGAISLQVAGLGYFSFFALLLSLLSIVPLGGGILTIPIGIVMLLFGNVSGGLIVLLVHFIFVTNIDNVIRPKLVPNDLSLNPALTMIAVFSGLALFGFIGIVVGPVLFILALTTLQVYAKLNDIEEQKTIIKAA
jgi:predicted PurR-regulated permease PerM